MKVKLLHEDAKLPTRSYKSAGHDLYAPEYVFVRAGGHTVVPLGIATELPSGYFGRILCRSGLAAKGLAVLGGVIDNDYRGEWKVILYNTSEDALYLEAGSRVAQAVLIPYGFYEVEQVTKLSETVRGARHFGSTGR